MAKFNWKSLSLLAAVVVAGAIILLLGFVSTLRLPLLGLERIGAAGGSGRFDSYLESLHRARYEC